MKTANGRILERLLDPVFSSLNEEAAQKLIAIKADAKARVRVDELARKCNEGELTPEERAEYESYVLAGDVIAVLQAKARLLLREAQARQKAEKLAARIPWNNVHSTPPPQTWFDDDDNPFEPEKKSGR